MNTEQLEAFIQVAEHLNFARAAEALQITQSAVSRQIHSLENELGTKLFRRTTRSVSLTPAGISFWEDAKNIMARFNVAAHKLQHHQPSNVQVVTIGCQNEVYLDFLCSTLKACREQIPELYPLLQVIPHRSLLNSFYQGDIDLLFGFKDDITRKNDIIYQELYQIPLCCIFSKTHPYAAKAELTKEDLEKESTVVCNSYAVPAKVTELHHTIAQHIPLASTYFCGNLQALITLVRAGYGYSILPQMNLSNSDIQAIPLKESPLLSYGIFYKKNVHTSILKKFIAIAKTNFIQKTI